MNNNGKMSFIARKMSNIRIGQRLLISMMIIVTILVIPTILVITQAIGYQNRYNRTLENLGDQINTPGDDRFPYCRTDSILYFSSNGHAGFGGLDIFKATLQPSGKWFIENMGAPINSTWDDFGITFDRTQTEAGYFSSNRKDGRGYDHIFSFIKPDLKVWISGYVLDKDEEPVPNAIIRIVGNDGSNQKAVAKPDGSFRFDLERGVSYVMLAGANGYLNGKQEFTSDVTEEDAEYNVDFILAAMTKPQVIENIFYDYNRATLRPESKAALDSMVQVLKDNPYVTIEMSSHTDRIGSQEFNLDTPREECGPLSYRTRHREGTPQIPGLRQVEAEGGDKAHSKALPAVHRGRYSHRGVYRHAVARK